MKIRVLGAGWYGCHLGLALKEQGHAVEIHESTTDIFLGASGSNPARLHEGFHYPRSRVTRAFCQDHKARFLAKYGKLTRAVPINVYAIAATESLVDFGTYLQILGSEVDLIPIYDPAEFGLKNVEGAVLTGERHLVIREAREYFKAALGESLRLNTPLKGALDSSEWDWTIDCTFCALSDLDVDRYEPCVTGILYGPIDRAVTIMDGPFPSLYPWDEDHNLSSITSAKYTPLARVKTYEEARSILAKTTLGEGRHRVEDMINQLAFYWPGVNHYKIATWKQGIRAMPKSAADARVVDVHRQGDRWIKIRAGKIDAVFQAQALVEEIIKC